MAKNMEIENKLHNMIGPGTIITGNIETNGDIRIDGEIKGNITSKGKVVIGNNGSVLGDVACTNCEIAGTVTGKLIITEILSLKATSKFKGDIQTTKLSIEPGAIFSGNCSMGDNNNE